MTLMFVSCAKLTKRIRNYFYCAKSFDSERSVEKETLVTNGADKLICSGKIVISNSGAIRKDPKQLLRDRKVRQKMQRTARVIGYKGISGFGKKKDSRSL